MKVLTANQIKELDACTIEHDTISSIQLMERAAIALTASISSKWANDVSIKVFAGPGGNGGDALCVARLLSEQGYKVDAFLFNIGGSLSVDCAENVQRLKDECPNVSFTEVIARFEPPVLTASDLVIDGLFGIGLNKALNGGFASLVKYINNSGATVVALDVPSGLMAEDNSFNIRAHIIRANVTLTLQVLKPAFLLADNAPYVGEIEVLDIGLNLDALERIKAYYTTVDSALAKALLKVRNKFAHKGTFGHTLLIAGSYGMAGAAILSAQACLRSGVGKLTLHTPKTNSPLIQQSVPCAVIHHDTNAEHFTEAVDSSPYQSVAIGPGLGLHPDTAIAFIEQVRHTAVPLVIDADGLNIFAGHHSWLQQMPKNTIITPHPKELQRLLDNAQDSFETLRAARAMAKRQSIYVIIKGHHTAICCPDGHVYFNTTGNAGMATAGSGDVLTGILGGLLAQGYGQKDACLLGCYLHGLSGDIAARDLGEEGLIATDLVDYLPKAFLELRQNTI
ncbi:MAG: NAD(P)H-hydrate dehydratase [Bacteroidaceae bacterium]